MLKAFKVMTDNSFEDLFAGYFSEGLESFLSHLSVNCVVLAYKHPNLQVLVHKMPGQEFSLIPGGFVKKAESVDDAAYRNLAILGIKEVFLRQIKTFGDVRRGIEISDADNILTEENRKIYKWSKQRFVTVAYYGLINYSATQIVPGGLVLNLEWLNVDHLENMGMDHGNIVSETRKLLATELLNYPVLSNLLPETFTLNELRGLFEAILERPIDRGTFRRKMLKLDLVEQIDRRKDTLGRPSHLFRFKTDKYQRFLAEENKFGF